jgi:hypothetical protein
MGGHAITARTYPKLAQHDQDSLPGWVGGSMALIMKPNQHALLQCSKVTYE